MSSAVRVQTYGRGSVFQCSIHARMSVSSAVTERCTPRRMSLTDLGEEAFDEAEPACARSV
jgi:hypothetical protein